MSFYISAVYINCIAQALKCIETDADWQTFVSSGSFIVDDTTGLKTIYFKLRDDVYNESDKTWDVEYGEDYTIKSDFDFLFSDLPKGEYLFSFALDTKFSDHTYSEMKEFTIE